MQKDETTHCMIRTPFGLLSMPQEIYFLISALSEQAQWVQLERIVKSGNIQKAKALQWYWAQKPLIFN